MQTSDLLILSFYGFYFMWIITHSTPLYAIIVQLLLLHTLVYIRDQSMALCSFYCVISLFLPILIHTLSCTIYLLMTHNYRSLLAMNRFPSNTLWIILVLHHAVFLLWMHMSPMSLGHATLIYVDRHLISDSWQVQLLPTIYPLLFCQELSTVISAVWLNSWCDIPLATDTELCSSSNLALSKVI